MTVAHGCPLLRFLLAGFISTICVVGAYRTPAESSLRSQTCHLWLLFLRATCHDEMARWLAGKRTGFSAIITHLGKPQSEVLPWSRF